MSGSTSIHPTRQSCKIREMIVAARVERTLSKAEVFELYLNSVYFGRGAWGIEMGARAYFGKPSTQLTLQEGALLATLIKGPTYFNPDRHPGRARERLAYIFKRMQEDGIAQAAPGLPALPALVAYERSRRDIGFYFSDQVIRDAKSVAGHRIGRSQRLHGAFDDQPETAEGGGRGAAGGSFTL